MDFQQIANLQIEKNYQSEMTDRDKKHISIENLEEDSVITGLKRFNNRYKDYWPLDD